MCGLVPALAFAGAEHDEEDVGGDVDGRRHVEHFAPLVWIRLENCKLRLTVIEHALTSSYECLSSPAAIPRPHKTGVKWKQTRIQSDYSVTEASLWYIFPSILLI